VLGRVDMTGSLGLSRDDVNHQRILEIARRVFEASKVKGLECAMGGGVAKEALPFMRELGDLLDRYETRKVIFGCPAGLGDDAEAGILKAVGFELMWLKNKRDFYGSIYEEDRTRIEMLEARFRRSARGCVLRPAPSSTSPILPPPIGIWHDLTSRSTSL